MSDKENPVSSRIEVKKKVSQVAPSELKQNLKKKGGMIAATVIGFVVVVGFLAPKHASSVESKSVQTNANLKDSLQANLKALKDKNQRLKEELAEKNKRKMKLYNDGIRRPIIKSGIPEGQAPLVKRVQVVRQIQQPKMTKEMMMRMNAQTSFLSKKTPKKLDEAPSQNPDGSVNATIVSNDDNAKFLNSHTGIDREKASFLSYPEEAVPAGELVSATLETAINSELPGMVRAITSRDIYSFKGRNRLIPKGSTVVGQFSSQVVQGQSRVLVIWNRLMLPNGTMVALNSPGADSLGRSGQGANSVDRHFMERFGSSALLSVLGLYAATSGVSTQDQMNSISQYRQALSASFQNAAQQTLQKDMQIAPTLHIHQGSKINIFVSRDLSFHGVYEG